MFGIDPLVIVGVVVLTLVVWTIFTFNAFVRERNLIDEAWSGIDVQLKTPTYNGRALLDKIEGFKRFPVTEADRMPWRRRQDRPAEWQRLLAVYSPSSSLVSASSTSTDHRAP